MCFKTDNQPSEQLLTKTEKSSPDSWGNLSSAAGGVPPPKDAPDATDEAVRKRRAAEMTRLMLGMGARSSWGQAGNGADLQLGRKMLTGGGQ